MIKIRRGAFFQKRDTEMMVIIIRAREIKVFRKFIFI